MIRSTILACALLAGAAPAGAQTTTVLLVRHAEQEAGEDPGLSAGGQARADSLLAAVRTAGIAAIYHTQYRRTRETAAVVAAALGVEATTLGPAQGQPVADHAAQLAADILERHAGKTVLVVGHSNTVPLIAAALGAADVPPIATNEYHHLLVVLKSGDGRTHWLRARYGS